MDFWPLPTIPGHYVTLEVTDTGAGMTPEVLARAFEPFYSTKRMGRGLGLSAVIGIIANHGGGMRAQSEPGRGSSFKIYMPAMRGERSVLAGTASPTWRGEGLLLVVDDEPAVRGGVRMMAESLGFTVIELFRLHHKELAVVLLDLTMPRMNGREAFGEMRKIDKSVPVVFSSGYNVSDPDIPVVGLAGFLNKPYRMAEFQGVLQRAISQRSIAGA